MTFLLYRDCKDCGTYHANECQKFCGPDAKYYEHNYLTVELVTTDKSQSASISSCDVCDRSVLSLSEEERNRGYHDGESREIVLNPGRSEPKVKR